MKCKHGGHFDHVKNWIEKVLFIIIFYDLMIILLFRISFVRNVPVLAIVFLLKNDFYDIDMLKIGVLKK